MDFKPGTVCVSGKSNARAQFPSDICRDEGAKTTNPTYHPENPSNLLPFSLFYSNFIGGGYRHHRTGKAYDKIQWSQLKPCIKPQQPFSFRYAQRP
jgi:hypothetical protein